MTCDAIIENVLKKTDALSKLLVFHTILDFEKYRLTHLSQTTSAKEDRTEPDPPGPVRDQIEDLSALSRLHVMFITASMIERNNLRSLLNKLSIKKISETKDCIEASRMLLTTRQKIDVLLLNLGEARTQATLLLNTLRTRMNNKNTVVLLFNGEKAGESLVKEAMNAGATGQIRGMLNEKYLKEQLLSVVKSI